MSSSSSETFVIVRDHGQINPSRFMGFLARRSAIVVKKKKKGKKKRKTLTNEGRFNDTRESLTCPPPLCLSSSPRPRIFSKIIVSPLLHGNTKIFLLLLLLPSSPPLDRYTCILSSPRCCVKQIYTEVIYRPRYITYRCAITCQINGILRTDLLVTRALLFCRAATNRNTPLTM